jgi:putative copper resistance protein D
MLFKLSLFLHVLAAILWIGGMLFLTLIIAPFLKSLNDRKQQSFLYQMVGTRYRFWGWISIVILLITGPLNLYLMGISPLAIFNPTFHGTDYGFALMMKLGFVFIIVVSSILHDFWLGPKARNSPEYTKVARIFGRSNLVIALLIVIFAVFLRTGGM